MIHDTEDIIEKHPNGDIKYVEKRGYFESIWKPIYPNHRVAPDGRLWIRMGVNKKFRSNGHLEWEIKYDDHGNVVKY